MIRKNIPDDSLHQEKDEEEYIFITNFPKEQLDLYREAMVGFDMKIKYKADDINGKSLDSHYSLWKKEESLVEFWKKFKQLKNKSDTDTV